ncbi:MAG: RNA-binding S4 domain-containing protein, partial [Phycisphaerae bacterium]
KTIVSQFYNEATAQNAAAEFEKVFAQKQLPNDMPEFQLPAEPVSVKQLLLACKLVETGGEAKRMCSQSAVTIDGEKITDPNAEITPKDGIVIQVGKRRFARVRNI